MVYFLFSFLIPYSGLGGWLSPDGLSNGFFCSPLQNLQDITNDQAMYVFPFWPFTVPNLNHIFGWVYMCSDQRCSSTLRQGIQFQDYLAMSKYLTRLDQFNLCYS